MSGERILITLFGFGADFATGASGANVHEYVYARGTTTSYPGARPMFGVIPPQGFVTVSIRADPNDGLGNRTVKVHWPFGGLEKIDIKIVATCAETEGRYRRPLIPAYVNTGAGGVTTGINQTPNLIPYQPQSILARPVNPAQIIVPTTAGGITQVEDAFGVGIPEGAITSVPVPDLVWGITGNYLERVNVPMIAELIDFSDPANPRVLDSLDTSQTFGPTAGHFAKTNYPGRPTHIQVIKNPITQFGNGTQQFIGTFTSPGSAQALDPMKFKLVVDPGNAIRELSEFDNEIVF